MLTRSDVIILAAGSAGVASVTAPILPAELALHWYCMAGAVFGAIAAAGIPTKEEPSYTTLAWRIFGCALFGISLSPWLIRRFGWAVDPETVLGVSAAVGVASWVGGRLVSSMTTRELLDAIIYCATLGKFGKLPGGPNGTD